MLKQQKTAIPGKAVHFLVRTCTLRWLRCIAGCVVFSGILGPVQADGLAGALGSLSKEEKLVYSDVAIAGAVAAWGFANWDYGDYPLHGHPEHWFGRETKEGGADKLGHAYSSYVLTHGFNWVYQGWGFGHNESAAYGALSSLGVQTFMELGDGFSRYGLAYEDLVMNAVGTAFGYLSLRYPELSRKLDFRIEYAPRFDTSDVFTDYEHQKYLLALKLDGFDALTHSPLRFAELQLGYYTRGYSNSDSALTERNVYVGIGINLSHIFREQGFTKTATALHYYQPPYASLQVSRNLDR